MTPPGPFHGAPARAQRLCRGSRGEKEAQRMIRSLGRRCRGDLWSPACPRIHQPVGRDDLGAPSACRDAPGGRAFPAGAPLLMSKAVGKPPGLRPWTRGSWRRWAVRTGQRPGVHCRPLRRHKLRIARFAASGKAHSLHCASSPHRTRFAGLRRGPRNDHLSRRCRASGGTHRDYPAGPDGRCAVQTWPAGPPSVPCP